MTSRLITIFLSSCILWSSCKNDDFKFPKIDNNIKSDRFGKGKIHEIRESQYQLLLYNGEYVKDKNYSSIIPDYTFYEFDINGNMTKRNLVYSDSKHNVKEYAVYNYEGNILESGFIRDGLKVALEKYRYDENNNKIICKYYHIETGEILKSYEYIYDYTKLSKVCKYKKGGDINESMIITKYNRKGEEIKTENYNQDGKKKSVIEYSYDVHGNITLEASYNGETDKLESKK